MSEENNPIKVSVIIAMKNAKKYISRAVDSILAQSLGETEIIIVDDSSADGGDEIIRQYYETLSNIHLFYNKGVSGPGICRNIGLDHAQGEFIAFLDSDDFADPDFLKILYGLAVRQNADIAVCGFDKISEDAFLRSHTPSPGIYAGGPALTDRLGETEFVVWNKIYRRSLIEKNKIRFRLPCYGEDWLFTFEAMFSAGKYVCTDKSLYYYYQHYDSVSHKRISSDAFDCLYDFFIFLEQFIQKQKNLTGQMIMQIEHNFFFAAIICYVAPFYNRMTDEDRDRLRQDILPRQFGKGALHVRILLDAFFELYGYAAQSTKYKL